MTPTITQSVSQKQQLQTNGHSKTSSDKLPKHQVKPSTIAIHAGNLATHWTHNPIVSPIYLSTTYETPEPGKAAYEYSRADNPTRTELQSQLAALEGAEHSLVFSSGLGAITTAMFLLESGKHVLCSDDVYGGTNRFFINCASRMGIETTFVDGIRVDNWINNFQYGKTKMVWIESPSNPTMKIIDIKKVSYEIKKLDPDCIVVVDNTFMTPVFQNPLKMGADVVMHSCTKYINGHSDVIMGALITNSEDIHSKLKFFQNTLGIISSPFDCYQVSRSIKTLHVRMEQHARNALQIAMFLEQHRYVEQVIYPGLKSHPQYQLANQQCTGFSGMISIYVKEKGVVVGDEVMKIVKAVKLFKLAVSLGSVGSFIEIPYLSTHVDVSKADRIKLGINENMIRLSVGLENAIDLIKDLDEAIVSAYE